MNRNPSTGTTVSSPSHRGRVLIAIAGLAMAALIYWIVSGNSAPAGPPAAAPAIEVSQPSARMQVQAEAARDRAIAVEREQQTGNTETTRRAGDFAGASAQNAPPLAEVVPAVAQPFAAAERIRQRVQVLMTEGGRITEVAIGDGRVTLYGDTRTNALVSKLLRALIIADAACAPDLLVVSVKNQRMHFEIAIRPCVLTSE